MTITALSDAQLIEQARGGDEAAFTELYVRHQPAALRLARTYRRLGDPDELVNGAFERVLGAIKRGAGPTESFRAYLFVTLRRFAAEKAGKLDGEESLDDVPEPITEAADSPALEQADRALITEAFESLPERWQAVLWHTAVEGQPAEGAGRRARRVRQRRCGHVVPRPREAAAGLPAGPPDGVAGARPRAVPLAARGVRPRGSVGSRHVQPSRSISKDASRAGPWWPSSRT